MKSGCEYCAQAMGPTELRCFALQPFLAVASGDPRFLLKLYESVSHDLSRAYELALSVGQRDAGSSVAAFLLGLEARARAQREPSDFVALPMSRGDIADYLSISFETVSRVFTSFKKRGYIALFGRRGVRLIDRDSLRTIAMSEDSGMRRAAVSR